ncbi:MAG TPA: DUF1549 domain-containing protein [Pirellulales bacterium]|nr:DUF1549 domain-containing protein [Pirellulales bacterium]
MATSTVAAVHAERLTFERDVMPILTAAGCNQGACHGKSRGQNGFQLSLLGFDADFDYTAIVQEGRGRRVFPAAPDQSLLLQKATARTAHGGGERLQLGSDRYAVLHRWIAAGMPRRTSDDPVLVGIAVSPPERPLAAGEALQLSVVERYSDGSTRDVTALGAYQSSDPAIAAIDDRGRIVAGKLPGETSLMVRYMGNIATWNVVIPRPERLPAERYAALPRHNLIDELVYHKLAQVAVLPSPSAADHTFLRRAYLDVIGRLPSADEARAFLDDQALDKRARLVDALLERPEYADHWANKWADLLRPNPYRVGIKATLNFDAWIREAFRRNQPYDQFVFDLLTARGSTWRNGATVLFRDKRTPEELTTITSQLFLGVRLDCARCHHHPFEVWGQDDFYGMAAYFARIGFKGTGISAPISGGEEMIYASPKGAVKHPLSGVPVEPRPLAGQAEVAATEDPREALARWIIADENPYFARVAVNRLWAEVMGRGIVEPVDDLRATNPPTNAALLDALVTEFRRVRYDNKALLRWILTSHVYELASLPNETNVADTQNYSRHYRTRLRGEALLDAVSDITGQRESFDATPPGTRAVELWTHRSKSLFLDAFGRPDPNQDPPCERTGETTMVQALHLMNSPKLQSKLTEKDSLPETLAASDKTPAEIVEQLYLCVYSRYPTADESNRAAALYADEKSSRTETTQDLLWAMLNTPEFLYKD